MITLGINWPVIFIVIQFHIVEGSAFMLLVACRNKDRNKIIFAKKTHEIVRQSISRNVDIQFWI